MSLWLRCKPLAGGDHMHMCFFNMVPSTWHSACHKVGCMSYLLNGCLLLPSYEYKVYLHSHNSSTAKWSGGPIFYNTYLIKSCCKYLPLFASQFSFSKSNWLNDSIIPPKGYILGKTIGTEVSVNIWASIHQVASFFIPCAFWINTAHFKKSEK